MKLLINENKLLAIIKEINKFEVFLFPKPFIIETDNTQVAGFIRNNCETPRKSNFLKKGKIVILVKNPKFF